MSSIITITNCESGELHETKLEIEQKHNSKYAIGGYKMYTKGVKEFILALTKQEAARILDWHADTDIIGPNNLFKSSFRYLTDDMDRQTRSKFKRKLLDANILLEYSKPKQLMLNPYMFMPRKDKTFADSQYWTQRVWLYLAEDKDIWSTELDDNLTNIFT